MTKNQYTRREFLRGALAGSMAGVGLPFFGGLVYHAIADSWLDKEIEQLESKAIETTKRLGNQSSDVASLRVTKRDNKYITIGSFVVSNNGKSRLQELTIDEKADIPGPAYTFFSRVTNRKKEEIYHEIPGTNYGLVLKPAIEHKGSRFFDDYENTVLFRMNYYGTPLVKKANVGQLNSGDLTEFKRRYIDALREIVAHGEIRK